MIWKICFDMRWKDRLQNVKGVAAGVMSALCWAIGTIQLKFVQEDASFLQFMTIRCIFITFVSVPFLFVRKEPFFVNNQWLWLSAIFDITATFCIILSFANMAYADASAIFFSQSVFIGVFGFLFFKERCGVFETIITALTVLGVILVVQPASIVNLLNISTLLKNNTGPTTSGHHANRGHHQNLAIFSIPRWQACLIAVLAAILCALSALFTRKCVSSGHGPFTLLFQFKSFGMICYFLILYIVGDFDFPYTLLDCGYLFVAAFGNWLGYLIYFYALKWEKAAVVSISRTTEVAFAYILQIIFISADVNIASISGAAIITCSACACGLLSLRREDGSAAVNDGQNEPLFKETTHD
ncbi:solute carrier family 35 member G1-like [Lineus longissimus]|uniref:solute carrier family 35 member G1-like n=1 Tax=Lineus longissimus TaxID=88925 RepID=UPI002B4F661B